MLAHTSGLPDYFHDSSANENSLEVELKSGKDQYWHFDQVIAKVKSITPLFIPGRKNKAYYSDTNFQLLGKIIETVTSQTYETCCNEFIIQPLKLYDSHLYQNASDNLPQMPFYKARELHVPKAMSSFGPDGGIVSTSSDLLRFTESFFTGKPFPKQYINNIQKWNNIFFPLKSGIGIQLFKLPWIFNPLGTIPGFIGYAGLSGPLAFHCPTENIYITGTVNQVAHPNIAFRTMIKLTNALMRMQR